MKKPFEEMDQYRSKMIELFVDMASAARDVVKSDGTDRLSIEKLREVLYQYNAWLGDDEA
jgi:Spy/CpxP family protein refolding chaperone